MASMKSLETSELIFEQVNDRLSHANDRFSHRRADDHFFSKAQCALVESDSSVKMGFAGCYKDASDAATVGNGEFLLKKMCLLSRWRTVHKYLNCKI